MKDLSAHLHQEILAQRQSPRLSVEQLKYLRKSVLPLPAGSYQDESQTPLTLFGEGRSDQL